MKLEEKSNTKLFFLALTIFYLKPLCFKDTETYCTLLGKHFLKKRSIIKRWGEEVENSKAVDKPKGLFGL